MGNASATIIHQQITKSSRQKKNKNVYESPSYDFYALAELFTLNTYHQTCINLKSALVTGLGYTSDNKQVLDFINNHSVYAEQSFSDTLYNIWTDYELYGNAFIEVVRNKKEEIIEIYHIPAKYCMIQIRNDNIVLIQNTINGEVLFNKLGTITKEYSEFIQIKNYNPKSIYYGLPEYVSCIPSMVLDKNAKDYNISYFENDAKPNMIIKFIGAEISPTLKNEIATFFSDNTKGVTKKGKCLILQSDSPDDKIEVDEIGDAKNTDAAYRGLREDNRDEIITAHRVPKSLIGISKAGSLGNKEDAELKIFKTSVIDPKKSKLEFTFNEILFKSMNIENPNFKLTIYDIDDSLVTSQYYKNLVEVGIYTPSEAKDELQGNNI